MRRALLAVALLAPVLASGRSQRVQAVLINGGHKATSNYESHLVHLEGMSDVLRSRGVDDQAVFSSDGSDPEPDMAVRDPFEHPLRWLLDGTPATRLLPKTELEDTQWEGPLQPATPQALTGFFSDPGVEAGDTLFLYTTDHGWRNKETGAAGLWLWGKKVDPDEMNDWISTLPDGVTTVMVMSHCYSGAFSEVVMDGPLDGSRCGFFSVPTDRPAYGCYPEGRSSKTIGHGFRFIDALDGAQSAAQAHERVLQTDRTPDVPLATSDLYLRRVVELDAAKLGVTLDAHVDAVLAEQDLDPLIAEVASGFGLEAPQSLAHLAQLRAQLEAAEPVVKQNDSLWTARLEAMARQNVTDFAPDGVEDAEPEALIAALQAHAQDTGLWPDLQELARRQSLADAIRWRMQVREAALMRIEILLISQAGEVVLSSLGRRPQRRTLRKLQACEATPLGQPTRPERPLPAPWPSLAADTSAALRPSFLGVRLAVSDAGETVVERVLSGTPAESAGLEEGDVIVASAGVTFASPAQVRAWAALQTPDEPITVDVRRAAGLHTLTITPGAFPPPEE